MTAALSLGEGFNELLCVLEKVGILLEKRLEVRRGLYIVEEFRVLFRQPEGRVPDLLLFRPYLLDGFIVEGLSAPHTLWFVPGRLSGTPRTLDGGPVLGFGGLDLFPLKPGVLGFGILSEPGNIPGDGPTPSGASLSVLAKSSPASEILLQSTPPDQGSKHTSGASEPFFKYYLENYFPNLITQNVNMLNPKNSPGYEYEPDFAFIDSNSGIHIDIEIDEPYKLKGYNPTHFIGQDNKRDDFFLSRNWIVVRFAEEQVCRWPKECCKEIALIVDEITGTYYLNLFENVDRLPSVPQWTEEDAIDLANKRDRDRYLPSP